MLKKFGYVVLMTGSKASEPITSFLVLGGLTTPSQFFCVFKFFFSFFFRVSPEGTIGLFVLLFPLPLLHDVLDLLVAAVEPLLFHDVGELV